MVQVIYIESSGKTWLFLGDRYLSSLIAQRLARSLRNGKVPGSNPTVGKYFSFCNSRFALRTGQISQRADLDVLSGRDIDKCTNNSYF